ncbi:hypothetical protein V1506DRAFT_335100 [Lipomyces tetrasporus]
MLLQPMNQAIDPASIFAVFPCSSTQTIVHFSGARDGEERGVYARVRRIKPGGVAKVYIVGKISTSGNIFDALDGAITLAKKDMGSAETSFVLPPAHDRSTPSPFNQLGFCTWSSIGERIRPTREKIEKLVQSLQSAQISIGSFTIDDGWQDIRSGMNGTQNTHGLFGFDDWDGMGCFFEGDNFHHHGWPAWS